jgi:hypothetical protein
MAGRGPLEPELPRLRRMPESKMLAHVVICGRFTMPAVSKTVKKTGLSHRHDGAFPMCIASHAHSNDKALCAIMTLGYRRMSSSSTWPSARGRDQTGGSPS